MDIQGLLDKLTDEDRAQVAELASHIAKQPFIPNEGRQTDAYLSDATIILYGGGAGGGKSALEVGVPVLDHSNSIIFRRESTQLEPLLKFAHQIIGDDAKFNGTKNKFTWPDGKVLQLAGMKEPDDWRKFAGGGFDYIALDEAGEFLFEQFQMIMGWLRTDIEGQRVRMILGSNPPRGGDGEWLKTEFAPWLEWTENRAEAGELRWAVFVDGKTMWVDGPEIVVIGGEEYTPISRTFIPALLDDNPFLSKTDYKARLQSLPEPMRSQLLYGDFGAGATDHEWQVFPTAWVEAAQNRWTYDRPECEMTAVAADVAQGGADKTQIQARYGDWFSEFTSKPGLETPDGPAVAADIVQVMRDRCRVIVDAGGGYGGDTLTQLAHTGIECYGYNGSTASSNRSEGGMFTYKNLRAQATWQLREALDPKNDPKIALPPDHELKADLTSLRYVVVDNCIKIGPKEEIKKRLGRSPDKGDTTIMLYSSHVSNLRRPAASTRRTNFSFQTTSINSLKRKQR